MSKQYATAKAGVFGKRAREEISFLLKNKYALSLADKKSGK
jgi:hypothetical protein